MKYLISIIILIALSVGLQLAYTVGLEKYCQPHFGGKRIHFWSQDGLDTDWHIDLLGVATRTMSDLIKNHKTLVEGAFSSAGNMHNPKVQELHPVFIKILSENALPFRNIKYIEKVSIVNAECN